MDVAFRFKTISTKNLTFLFNFFGYSFEYLYIIVRIFSQTKRLFVLYLISAGLKTCYYGNINIDFVFFLAIHPCSTDTSGCTHLCLKIPSGYKCDCPNVTSDGQNCIPSYVIWPTPTTPTTKPTTLITTPPPTTPVDYCESKPCLNGATCESATTGYKCHCSGYFGGPTCSVNIGELDFAHSEIVKM